MDRLNDGCILLKKKEYDDLLKEANKKKNDEIRLSWSYNYYQKNYGYYVLNECGTIILGDKLRNQITSILDSLTAKFNQESHIIRTSQKEYDRIAFSNLSLWKRMFFKP